MTQLQKYTWLIDTIRRAGKISHRDLSDKWELYYISNPEDIDEDELKKWMLDSFVVGNLIGQNLSLKNRILVDQIPSGRDHLTVILEAMRENRIVNIKYKAFKYSRSYEIPVEPYCVKLLEEDTSTLYLALMVKMLAYQKVRISPFILHVTVGLSFFVIFVMMSVINLSGIPFKMGLPNSSECCLV